MSAQPAISVVIPSYQRRESLRRALLSLAEQTIPAADYEVLVSLDGSDDGSREMAVRLVLPYRLHVLWQPNGGRASACNAGIRAAAGDLIVLLDDDMEAQPGFLAGHLAAHAGSDDPLGVVGAAPLAPDPTAPAAARVIATRFERHLARLAEPGHRFKLRDFYSGNFSIARQTMLAASGFDEAFKVYGHEDLELALRLSRLGVRFVYSTAAAARQKYDKNFAALARDNLNKGRTAVLLASKHPAALPHLRLSADNSFSPRWRMLRRALIAASRPGSWLPGVVIRLVTRQERANPARLELAYDLALDYFFWLGATAALREYPQVRQHMRGLAGAPAEATL